ncbi:hypothetical protein GCM10023115_51660 [Pontixanthobacter gangjinensis]
MAEIIYIVHFDPATGNNVKVKEEFLVIYDAGVLTPFFFMKMVQKIQPLIFFQACE